MLPPVTKQCDDLSTDQWFRFVFHCDECGAEWEHEQYSFSMRDTPQCDEVYKDARAHLWKAEHDAAYERANTEALFHFNQCPVCGRRVCDDCFAELEDVCLSCAAEKRRDHKPKKPAAPRRRMAFGKL